MKKTCDDRDFANMAKSQFSPITPDQLESTLRAMLPYINTDDMLTVFAEFKGFLPRDTLLALCATLKPSLPKADWTRLKKVVG